jgi:hypothetical protein
MELDLELVRTILTRVDRQPPSEEWVDSSIDGYEEGTVADHVRLLDSLGYIAAVSRPTAKENRTSVRLTLNGSDFLAKALDESIWSRSVEMVAEQVIGDLEFKLGVLRSLLEAGAKERCRKEDSSRCEALHRS